MKKVLIGILVGALVIFGVLLATNDVGACCDYEEGSCCWRMCCEEQTRWYEVSYFEKVESGFYTPWGTPMYDGVWTKVYVEARNWGEAAAKLGMKAGVDCFVASMTGWSPEDI